MSIVKKKSDLLDKKENLVFLTWKAVPLLKKYISRFDEIKPRKYNKHSVTTQKHLRKHIIRAREIGLLPYTK